MTPSMTEMKLIQCESQYYEFVRMLRTHPENIDGFIVQSTITKEQQIEYMEKYKNNYFICLVDDVPAGFVGVIDDDIRVATSPDFKKRGIGKFMITEVMKLYPNARAKIKSENSASIALFKSCGFKPEFIIMKNE